MLRDILQLTSSDRLLILPSGIRPVWIEFALKDRSRIFIMYWTHSQPIMRPILMQISVSLDLFWTRNMQIRCLIGFLRIIFDPFLPTILSRNNVILLACFMESVMLRRSAVMCSFIVLSPILTL